MLDIEDVREIMVERHAHLYLVAMLEARTVGQVVKTVGADVDVEILPSERHEARAAVESAFLLAEEFETAAAARRKRPYIKDGKLV